MKCLSVPGSTLMISCYIDFPNGTETIGLSTRSFLSYLDPPIRPALSTGMGIRTCTWLHDSDLFSWTLVMLRWLISKSASVFKYAVNKSWKRYKSKSPQQCLYAKPVLSLIPSNPQDLILLHHDACGQTVVKGHPSEMHWLLRLEYLSLDISWHHAKDSSERRSHRAGGAVCPV